MHAPVSISSRGRGAVHNGKPLARSRSPDRVILIPCSASSARQWDSLITELGGFQAVAVDLYGHGKRPRWHGEGALSLAHEAAAIWNVYPEGAPFHLVGHSYGGAVALRFALSFPERLRSLTLIEPSSFHLLADDIENHAHALGEIRAVAEALNCALLSGDYRGGMEVFIDYWGGARSWRKLPEEKRAQLATLAVYVAHHFCSLFGEKAALPACIDVNVPTLVLCGMDSPRPSQLIARLLADTIPHAQHRMIAGANHMAPITHPGEVNPLIREHLLRHGSQDQVPRPFGSASFVSINSACVQAI